MSARYKVTAHIPRGSADAEWRIVDAASNNHDVVCVVDPHQIYATPEDLANEICAAMNLAKVMD